MKIIQIISRLNIGGASPQVIHLTRALQERGYEARLIRGQEPDHEGNMLAEAARVGVEPVLIPELGREIDPRRDLVTLYKLVRFLRAERPDVVHTHLAKAGALGRLAAWLTGVPVILHTYHGHVFHSYFSPAKTAFFLRVERALARVSQGLIAISPSQQQELAAYLRVAPERLTMIRLGLDLTPFQSAEAGRFRRELGLGDEVPLVGIVGRLAPVKDHRLFLATAAVIRRRRPDVHFAVVGDGELRLELEAEASRLGLGERIHFTGWRSDMPQVCADLTVSLLTSHNEGTPTTVIEALASACPVVATGVGGVPDLMVDGIHGFVVAGRDPAHLADRTLALLDDAALRRRMGHAGRSRMLFAYSLKSFVDQTANLYLELMQQRKRRMAP